MRSFLEFTLEETNETLKLNFDSQLDVLVGPNLWVVFQKTITLITVPHVIYIFVCFLSAFLY